LPHPHSFPTRRSSDLAYVGVSGGIVAIVDLPTGAVISTINEHDAVHDVAFAGDELYVLTSTRLDIYGGPDNALRLLGSAPVSGRSEEHTSELQSRGHL